jgi:histidine phosphotransferase ChpT
MVRSVNVCLSRLAGGRRGTLGRRFGARGNDERLSDLELAALLCSRVCHDVISPVGAIANGLEILADEDDEEMRQMAFDLVRRSADQASAKLQFCRVAFGAAGAAGSSLDLGEAGEIARLFVGEDKTKLDWAMPHESP